MKSRLPLLLLCGAVLLVCSPARTRADAKDEKKDPAHKELRALRDGLIDAVNKGDRDRLLSYLHKNVVVTWMDGEVSRGPEAVRAYYDKMMVGDNRIVDSVKINPTVDALTILYGGDAGVSFGSSDDHFRLKRGLDFNVHTRWTATLVKEDGKWLIASFQASTSLFDNPLLDAAKRTVWWAAGIAAVAGLLVGYLLARLRGKRVSGP